MPVGGDSGAAQNSGAVENRAVRVEVLGAPDDGLEIPEVTAQSSGGSTLPAVLGLLILFGLGVILFGLRPEADQAADGTQREAPATTVPDVGVEEDGAEEDGVADSRSTLVDEPNPGDAGIAVTGRVVFDHNLIRHVVSLERGFLGSFALVVDTPQFALSIDGSTWTPTLSSVDSPEDLDLSTYRVVDVSYTDGQAVMVARNFDDTAPRGGQIETQIFTSPNGVAWELIDTAQHQAERRVPRLLIDDLIVATVDHGRPIDDLVRQHTDLALEDDSLCGMFRTPGGDPQFELFSCRGNGSFLLDETNIVSEVSADAVLGCVSAISPQQTGTRTTFSMIDSAQGTISPFGSGDNDWFLGPNQFPDLFSLSNGRVGFYDIGSRGARACSGIVDTGPVRDQSIVILDAATGSETVFPLPIDEVGVRMVGETRTFGDSLPFVLVEIDANLWALHPTSGRWSQLTGLSTDDAAQFFVVSDSGDRAFQLVGTELRMFDFDAVGDVLFAARQDIPVTTPNGEIVLSFETRNVLFASSDLLLVTNDANQLWRIDVTPADVVDQRGFGPDSAGVGSARRR